MQIQFRKRLVLLLVVFSFQLSAQDCSNSSLTAKYWQYRNNLNKHFILIDRDPSGCIQDGIGQDSDDPCACSKHGYSLPATSINIEANGALGGMKDRNNPGEVWYDPDCADGTSWATNAKHNWLDMGSETPHQMGWYWVVLASEYVLLQENGQLVEAQRTLEELFLGLQAYRRLDITANCLAAARYKEIADGYESSDACGDKPCLCEVKYQGKTTKNFDSPCDGNCPFIPNTSGYSGFYIREDATQELEKLHDDSEDKWNIDVVSSGYAMSIKPPCKTVFSPACYNVHLQNFMSQDGVIGLMIGLAVIKRFIPVNASVTTCDGTVYYPHSMAIQIAAAMVNRIDNTWLDKISWPGSYQCCEKEVFLSEHDGGFVYATMTGLKKACSFIDGVERHSDAGELFGWYLLTEQTRKLVHGYVVSTPFISLASLIPKTLGDNANFWIRLKTLGCDMGGAGRHSLYQDGFRVNGLEIMPIINNLLYPAKPNLGIDQAYYKKLLCEAPCGGPCTQGRGYPIADNPSDWPKFTCPNTPEWVGQRWETHNEASTANRQFNGLDYMALYNLYMLYFPEERTPYADPASPNFTANHALGAAAIDGPLVVCPGEKAIYTLQIGSPTTALESITWQSSEHLSLTTLTGNPTEATFEYPSASNEPFIAANFKTVRQLQQFYAVNTGPGKSRKVLLPFDPVTMEPFQSVADVCELTYYKPILSGSNAYTIRTQLDHCSAHYSFHAEGPPAQEYRWKITADPANPNLESLIVEGNGKDFFHARPKFPGMEGRLTIQLTVISDCGTFESTLLVPYSCAHANLQLRVDPNPAQDDLYIHLYQEDQREYDVVPTEGVLVQIIPSNGGVNSMTTKLNANHQGISIASLPNGIYRVLVTSNAFATISSKLVILR